MKRFAITSLAVWVAALVTVGAGPLNLNQEPQTSVPQLGPDGFRVAPQSMEGLVKAVPAAVIATIVEPGELKLEDAETPYSKKRTVRGYVTYQAIIREVVFNRSPAGAPPLLAGSAFELRQEVGRESAEAFLARRIPVASGDECLLFLWLQPQGWSMLDWHVQFRKSKELPNAAEALRAGGLSAMAVYGSQWVGSSVALATAGDVAMPDWNGLVAEVRRLGKASSAR
jgi:hypothetical protein